VTDEPLGSDGSLITVSPSEKEPFSADIAVIVMLLDKLMRWKVGFRFNQLISTSRHPKARSHNNYIV